MNVITNTVHILTQTEFEKLVEEAYSLEFFILVSSGEFTTGLFMRGNTNSEPMEEAELQGIQNRQSCDSSELSSVLSDLCSNGAIPSGVYMIELET